mmetsp:Transcript_94436/g.182121  ORF Transcript_94436/g.182121 Transcript_94436/m.182121 type:complete len:110 (+) Transcript_94436:967-1296(+)
MLPSGRNGSEDCFSMSPRHPAGVRLAGLETRVLLSAPSATTAAMQHMETDPDDVRHDGCGRVLTTSSWQFPLLMRFLPKSFGQAACRQRANARPDEQPNATSNVLTAKA